MIQLLRAGAFEIAISVALVIEYEAVLIQHADSLGLRRSEAVAFVDYLCAVGKHSSVHFLWRPTLRDPDDEFVLELAVTAGCESIITHNVRDFAGARRFGVNVLRPGQFLHQLKESS